jgi:glycosyltransferase involved in cell wall biosynthesis
MRWANRCRRARNVGLRYARAPLTVFLDADDILIPNALEEMAQAYIDSDGAYIYGDWVHLEDETRLDGAAVLHYTPEYDPELWIQGAQHAVTCLLPTDKLRGWAASMKRCQPGKTGIY